MLSTLDGIRSELPGLGEIVGREIIRDVAEGVGHKGKSAVVQFIGRRT